MYTACLNYGNLAKGHRATGMTADGGFAQYAVHHVSALYKLPEGLSWEDAVLVTTAGTSLYGLDAVGGYIAGQSVVVIGPGPVGLMTTQACKALGADQVVLIGTRANRLELGARLGADHVVNGRDEDPVAAVRRLIGKDGADLVIEASGALEAPQQTVQMVKRGGKILFLAFYTQQVTFDLSTAIREDVTLYTTRGEGAGAVKRALSLARQGKIRGRDLVTHRFPLEQIQEGFRILREREGDPIKVVIIPKGLCVILSGVEGSVTCARITADPSLRSRMTVRRLRMTWRRGHYVDNGSASIRTKAMRHTASERLSQAWKVPR
jgi:L-iditol 2-dehydrogenase